MSSGPSRSKQAHAGQARARPSKPYLSEHGFGRPFGDYALIWTKAMPPRQQWSLAYVYRVRSGTEASVPTTEDCACQNGMPAMHAGGRSTINSVHLQKGRCSREYAQVRRLRMRHVSTRA